MMNIKPVTIGLTYLTVLTVMLICFSTNISAKEYFVSPQGKDSNDGATLENAWRSIIHAASQKSPIQAGDTVHVKAGRYSGEIVFTKGGNEKHPIVFSGYRQTPGDNPRVKFDLNKALKSVDMPLLDGQDRTKGLAMNVAASYIHIRNFQITNYRQGVSIWGKTLGHITVENVILSKLGALDGTYSGIGINATYASHITVKNCIVANAQAEGISFIGNHCKIIGSKVYSDEVLPKKGAEGTDYYINGMGHDNLISACYIERIVKPGLLNFPHVGHGIGFKESSERNLVKDCVAVNLRGGGFYVRWESVKNNTVIP